MILGIVKCITVKLDRRLAIIVHCLISCKHDTGKALIQICLSCESSLFAGNCRYLMYKYNIHVFAWHG